MPNEILLLAADLLETEGWTQYATARLDGDKTRRCAIGAIRAVAYKLDRRYEYQTATDLLREKVGPFVTKWNDAPGRTAKEVIATLREAAQ